jgi:predicted aldo/keto reductase-like oxidoreductase
MLARSTFESIPDQTRTILTQLDFKKAEQLCPRNLPIDRLMKEAANLLA